MSANPKIVVRFNLWQDPAMAERLAREADIELLNGERPPRLVNPEAWPAYRARFDAIMGPADLRKTSKAM